MPCYALCVVGGGLAVWGTSSVFPPGQLHSAITYIPFDVDILLVYGWRAVVTAARGLNIKITRHMIIRQR